MRKILIALAVALPVAASASVALPAAVWAASPPPSPIPSFTAEQKADLQRIEGYFNAVRTLRAGFLQVDDAGGVATGKLYLQRPGRMRFQYEPPNPNLIVSDGTFLVHYDQLMDQTTHIPLDSTPIGFLARDKVDLTRDVAVVDLQRSPGVLRLTMRNAKDWDSGELQLVFSDAPLKLEQWIVTDPQRRRTKVSLQQVETGVKIESQMFIPPQANRSAN